METYMLPRVYKKMDMTMKQLRSNNIILKMYSNAIF